MYGETASEGNECMINLDVLDPSRLRHNIQAVRHEYLSHSQHRAHLRYLCLSTLLYLHVVVEVEHN